MHRVETAQGSSHFSKLLKFLVFEIHALLHLNNKYVWTFLHLCIYCIHVYVCVWVRVYQIKAPSCLFPAMQRWHRRPHWPWFIGIRIHMTAINLHPLTTSPALSFLLSVDILHSCTITLNILRLAPHSPTFSFLSMFCRSLPFNQSLSLYQPLPHLAARFCSRYWDSILLIHLEDL